ncbi:hypothetical protein [Oleiharenicola lentus]|uniref:hypothetical protein n=1 Tax=Oleiharenicola lentus TaxID=2508720 RepID=UPI003F669593
MTSPRTPIYVKRALLVVIVSTVAGLVVDWLRSDQRVVFSRPLPKFRSVESFR